MQCAILIGGLGTRLGTLVKDCPKPMLPVAGCPFIVHLLENLARFGFSDIVLLAGYKSKIVQAHFDAAGEYVDRLGLRVRIVSEPEPLGTAGALRHARGYLASEFLLMNGDSFFDFNLLDLLSFPIDGPWLARMALRHISDASRYGVVSVNENERVLEMKERPDPSVTGPGIINGGIYWLKREIIDSISEGECSLERDIFPRLAAEGRLFGREYRGFFLDIGIQKDYLSAQTLLPIYRPAIFFDRDGVLNHDSGYTYRIADFRWIDGAIEAIRKANEANWFVFVVTNQAGIARGYYEETDVQTLHNWMNETLCKTGAHIDDFRYCPHHPDGVIPRYAKTCQWRKPNPGMIEDLIEKWPVDVEQSVLIGDKDSDLKAALAADVKPYLFCEQDGNASSFSSILSEII